MPGPPNFCKNCSYWSLTFKREKQFGLCEHPLVTGKILLDRQQSVFEEGTAIYTEEHFGCLQFMPVHGNVVSKIDLEHD